MAGDDPFPSTMAVPCEGEVTSDHAREDALVSESVAFNSLAVQVAEVSSLMVLDIGPTPWLITGEDAIAPNKLMITDPWPEFVLILLFWSVPEL